VVEAYFVEEHCNYYIEAVVDIEVVDDIEVVVDIEVDCIEVDYIEVVDNHCHIHFFDFVIAEFDFLNF